MRRSVTVAALFSGALLAGVWLGGQSRISPAHAETAPAKRGKQASEPAPDPNKKKDGEACKSSDECQRHHTCAKEGDKTVCQAPKQPSLPPGAVT